MTISTTGSRISYNGNGVTTAFSFPYFFFANGDLVVSLVNATTGVETAQVLNTDYTVTGAGVGAGGTVTMTVAPASGYRLVIYRDTAITQDTDYISGDAFPAETHERALDKLTVIAQEREDELDRSLKAPASDPTTLDMTLPADVDRKGKFLAFDASTGEPVASDGTVGGDASVITYTPAGTGAVPTNVQTKLREFVSVKDFGAVGDGVTDDTAAVDAAFTYCGGTGQKLYVPAGNYILSATISWPITNGFEVECEPAAVFKATAAVPVDNKLLQPSASSGSQRFVWRGGVIDGRLMPARVSGAPDLLYIASQYIKNVDIEGVTFICNDTRAGTASDSCLFLAEGEDYRVVGNVFQGAVDAGVYISGDNGATRGRRALITNNTFTECKDVGVITKRDFENHIFANNFFKNCGIGVVLGGAADLRTSAFKGVITGNILTNCIVGISVRICSGIVVSGNRIEDFGYDASGAAVAAPGIDIAGADHCTVIGNHLAIVSATTPDANTTGIQLRPRTELAVTYQSEYNLISGNTINGSPRGIIEDASSNYTLVGENQIVGATGTTLSLAGANSQFGPVITNSTTYRIGQPGEPSLEVAGVAGAVNYVSIAGSSGSTVGINSSGASTDVNIAVTPKGAGVILMGGGAGSEALRVSKGVASGNALQVNGAAAGSPPALVARGADTNVDLSLLPKGTGRVRFGTLTATADAPITGYIEVKDASGTVRKLAVIS